MKKIKLKNLVLTAAAVWVGMTSGASAESLTPDNIKNLHYIMFGLPIVLILLGSLVYKNKVTLDEKKHEAIVAELEKKWNKIKYNII